MGLNGPQVGRFFLSSVSLMRVVQLLICFMKIDSARIPGSEGKGHKNRYFRIPVLVLSNVF